MWDATRSGWTALEARPVTDVLSRLGSPQDGDRAEDGGRKAGDERDKETERQRETEMDRRRDRERRHRAFWEARGQEMGPRTRKDIARKSDQYTKHKYTAVLHGNAMETTNSSRVARVAPITHLGINLTGSKLATSSDVLLRVAEKQARTERVRSLAAKEKRKNRREMKER